MLKTLAFSVCILISSVAAAVTPESCHLSAYGVGSDGQRESARLLGPDDVSSIKVYASNGATKVNAWRVTLNDAGAAKNGAYTRAHVGSVVSYLCDDAEISRAAIRGEFANNFVINVADQAK